MAIARMAKVMIVCHRSQVSELLEALQQEGICQVLDAEQAAIARDLPEPAPARPRQIENLLSRLEKGIAFLKNYTEVPKGIAAALAPRTVVDRRSYDEIVTDHRILSLVDRCEHLEASMDKAKAQIEALEAALESLAPWQALETPVHEIGLLHRATVWTGLIPVQQFDQATYRLAELGAAVQEVGSAGNKDACLVLALNEAVDDVQKALRAVEFDTVSFEAMTGTVAELIAERKAQLDRAKKDLAQSQIEAHALAANLLKLEVLYDHYLNLLNRDLARDLAPATEYTVILEGWVKQKDYARLEQAVSRFDAASLARIEPAEGEDVPVEIENKRAIRPFEVITRLYGMPKYVEVDPTIFLAPFFALFFGLCLTDAGYGLVMVALTLLLVKKIQGDTKLMRMLGICGAFTVVAGALTGGWFGNAHEYLPGWFGTFRGKVMWFDPFEKPMMFFGLALALGYIQIMAGLAIAFGHNLRRRKYVAAVCDQLTWLVMLNSIALMLAGKFGVSLPGWLPGLCKITAIVPAGAILLFSQREGTWAGRLGMGLYNLFSTIFFMGDVLSYLRLMALGMVTAGLAMAINVIAQIAGQIPYGIGILATVVVLVAGHAFNMAINALGAFVHTLRLQYVEFFPKFLVGGGRAFEPLSKQYRHIYIQNK